ncbi:hypothetical protein BD413DRAFT_122445 [Trametes elegans]|nr:hypothetical protein BD413DRAFT_122445 [Trametes elegans]
MAQALDPATVIGSLGLVAEPEPVTPALPSIRSGSDTAVGAQDDPGTLPRPEELREEISLRYTEADTLKAWARSAELVKTYNDEIVERWQEEMDTLLVYAGLFSAVLTAFNVQSYQLLQPAPTDSSLAVLQQISEQLTSFSVNPTFINSTRSALSPDEVNPPFRPPDSAVWINALWFSSLVCSLASASVALMVKQWLHELSVGVSGTSRESARIRQYRVNSLRRWHVGGIVIVIPILLQIALVLFLAGLVVLLWTLHGTVAAIVSGLVGMLFVFLVVTTLLPAIKVNCCYRSPQAVGIFMAMQGIRMTVKSALTGFAQAAWNFSKHWRRHEGLLKQVGNLSWRIYVAICVETKDLPTWHGREQLEVARATDRLDRDLASMAYTTTFDAGYLDDMRMLLADMSWRQAVACYEETFAARARLWGEQLSRVRDRFPRHTYDVMHILLATPHKERDCAWQGAVEGVLSRLSPFPDELFETHGLHLLCTLAMGNNHAADTAFHKVLMHMRNQKAMRRGPTSRGMRAVMLMAEWRARNPGGSDSATTLRYYLQSIEVSIHCALRQHLLGLSTDEQLSVRARAQTALASLRDFLRTSLWREPSLYICLGLSNIVPLLVELVHADRELVTEDLVEVLDSVCSALQEGELTVADGDRLRRLHAYVEWTSEVLDALKAVMSGGPVNSNRRVVFKFDRPNLEPDTRRSRRFSAQSVTRSLSRLRRSSFSIPGV